MKKKFLAIILAIVIIATQGSMLISFSASAETTYTALTGRDDFVFGVNMRANNGYAIYQDSYTTIMDAKSLGSSIVRTKNTSKALNNGIADIAKQNGIDIMLVDTYSNYQTDVSVEELDLASIEEYYTTLATNHNGRIAYYQIGNEMDIPAKSSDYVNGITAKEFKNLDTIAVVIYTAVNAIKAVDPDAKVVVNTSWTDVGFIEGIKSVVIDTVTGTVAEESTTNATTSATWDLMGIDWYSNGRNEDFINPSDNQPYDYDDVITALSSYTEDVIICETNLWSTGYNEDGSVNYIEDADWLAEFAQYAYSQEKVKGFIAYELYDVAGLETSDDENGFDKEAHFGLIDKNRVRKDTFGVLQALYGGSDVARVETIPAVDTDEMAGDVVSMLYSDIYSFNLKNTHTGYNNSTMFFTTKIDPYLVNTSGMDVLEFDLYVEDAEAFIAASKTSGYNLCAWILGENRTMKRVAKGISVGNVEKDGWNHIVISGQQFDDRDGGNEIRGSYADEVAIGFQTSSSSDPYNPASGMKIAVSNVCFTKIPDVTTSTVGIKADNNGFTNSHTQNRLGLKTTSGFAYSGISTYSYMRSSTKVALNSYIEFDIYIDSYTNFKKSLSVDGNGNKVNYGLTLSLASSGNSAFAQQRTYDITNFISHSGWNHIILKDESTSTNGIAMVGNNGATGGSIYSAALAYVNYDGTKSSTTYYPRITDTTTMNPAGNDFFAMTPPIVSSLTAPEKDLKNKLEIADMEIYKTFKIGAYLPYANDNSKVTLTQEISMVDSEFVEFDFFVANDEVLKNIVSGYFGERILFRLHNASNGFAQYNIYSQIKQAGWNHIVIPVEELYTENFDRTNGTVTWVNICFSNDTGTNHPIPSTTKDFIMGMANVITTQAFPTPEKLMSDYTLIGEDKTLEVETVEGAFVVELTESVDISTEKMIEFDFYIENAQAVTGETFITLLDVNGYTAMFSFSSQIVSDGWNHIQIDIEDFELDDSSFAFASIVSWVIINENDLTGYVANLYAADYVDGDASRDGEFNIIDLVRIKKHIAGIDKAKTNVCAADYDNNYELNAVDLTQIRVALLTGF